MKTRLFPAPLEYGRMYLEDNGDPAGGGGGGGDAGGGEPAFEMPEKFQGKSAEDIAKSYSELERQFSRTSEGTAQYSKLEQQLAEQGEILRRLAESREENPIDDDQLAAQKKYYKETLGLVGSDELGTAVRQAQEAAVEAAKFDYRIKTLESTYNGADGKPKFDPKTVAQYALEKGMDKADPETVYEHMHSKSLIDWHVKEALKKQAPAVPGSGKGAQPPVQKTIADLKTPAEREKFLEDKIRARLE